MCTHTCVDISVYALKYLDKTDVAKCSRWTLDSL